MYRDLVVCVVVPAHNEEQLIATTIGTLPDWVDHVVLIDDKSTDATVERAEALGDPRLVVVRHEVNTGVGGAILDGHREAIRLEGSVSVVMAGDAQMDPEYLPALLDPIADGQVEFTKANRFASRRALQGMPRSRVLGSVVLSFMTKAASGYWNLFDPQNGYTAISRSALERLDLDLIATGYEFENDLLISCNIARVRARDVPIPARYGEEISGMRLTRVAPRIAGLLFRGFWRRMWFKYVIPSFSAVALLFFTGLALVLFGTAVGIWIVVNTLGPPQASAGTVLLCVGPLLTGMHFLVSALTLDIQSSND